MAKASPVTETLGFEYTHVMRNREIDIIRSILTIIVIAFHACCPYFSKTWSLVPTMHEENSVLYTYIGHTLYNGMLETFVLLSGFLYANTLKSRLTIDFCKKKILRLYIPCLLWGCIYSKLFCQDCSIINIVNGIGHLWFLPMLLWLFILERLVNKLYSIGCKDYHVFIILSIISIIPIPTLPLGLGSSLYYMLFFHCGVFLNRNYKPFISKIQAMNIWHMLIFTSCCALTIIGITELESPAPNQPLTLKTLLIFRTKLIHGAGAIAALPIYWKIATITSKKISQHVPILSLAKCSLGIYILQEFALRFLFYRTSFCVYFGDFSPILSVPIVLSISWFATTILTRYKTTKILTGY